MAAAGEAHISFFEWPNAFTTDAVCAALDALRGACIVTLKIYRPDFNDDAMIPASALSHHPSLRRLVFSNCAFPALCDLAGYTQLHGLRELVAGVSNNAPSYQLQHAQPLSQLEVLDLPGMETAAADASLAVLLRLRELNLSSSDLRTVPTSMASLTRLARLALSHTRVADGWQHLPLQLELLELGWARLSAVPPELSRLSRLTELDLTGNDELEGGSLQVLGRLSSLRKLGLSNCHLGDASLDAGLGVALPMALQRLDLPFNNLTAVPGALAPLTGLTELHLGRNQLAGGWQHLAGLQQVARLSVVHCSLSAVPEVLSQLTALTSLYIGGNSIDSGWQHLSLLPLCELWTDDPMHNIYPS